MTLPHAHEPRPRLETFEAVDILVDARRGRVALVVVTGGRQLEIVLPADMVAAAALRLHVAARTAIASAEPE